MDLFFELLKIVLPSIILAFITWYMVGKFIGNAENTRKSEVLLKNHEITIPLRFQAYERIALFLERISLDSLLMRINQSGMTSRQLHTEILASIRNEYEHNLSQQVYISVKAWEMVKNARAQMIKIINTAAEKTNPTLPSIELSKKILEIMSDYDKAPTQIALNYLKQEIQELF
jgi:hypothetical protein